jgi:hypothetical protein
MTPSEFINSIRLEVMDSTVDGLVAQLTSPSGRKPAKKIVDLSNWINGLPETDREEVFKIVSLATHNAVFGFLCVLDGVRPIEKDLNKGRLHLIYEKDGVLTHLNSPVDEMLHDIFNATSL